MQTAYIRLVCNPFYELGGGAGGAVGGGGMITSKRFVEDVRRIGEGWVPGSGVGGA